MAMRVCSPLSPPVRNILVLDGANDQLAENIQHQRYGLFHRVLLNQHFDQNRREIKIKHVIIDNQEDVVRISALMRGWIKLCFSDFYVTTHALPLLGDVFVGLKRDNIQAMPGSSIQDVKILGNQLAFQGALQSVQDYAGELGFRVLQ